MIELHFPVLGNSLPSDHGYALYSAISEAMPAAHNGLADLQIAPIPGQYAGKGLLHLMEGRSRLRFRLPAEDIPVLLPLAGKSLAISGHRLRVGVPQVRPLVAAPALVARMVTIKGFQEPIPFLEAVRRKLDALGIAGEAGIPLVRDGTHRGQPRRHIMRIHDKRVVGFALQVTELTAEESLRLQEQADPKLAFSRRKMGCGFFVPMRGEVV